MVYLWDSTFQPKAYSESSLERECDRNSDLGGVLGRSHQDLVVSLEVSYLHISEGQLGSSDTEVHLDGYVLPYEV